MINVDKLGDFRAEVLDQPMLPIDQFLQDVDITHIGKENSSRLIELEAAYQIMLAEPTIEHLKAASKYGRYATIAPPLRTVDDFRPGTQVVLWQPEGRRRVILNCVGPFDISNEFGDVDESSEQTARSFLKLVPSHVKNRAYTVVSPNYYGLFSLEDIIHVTTQTKVGSGLRGPLSFIFNIGEHLPFEASEEDLRAAKRVIRVIHEMKQ